MSLLRYDSWLRARLCATHVDNGHRATGIFVDRKMGCQMDRIHAADTSLIFHARLNLRRQVQRRRH